MNVFLPFLFALVLALGMFIGYRMPTVRNSSSKIFFVPNKRDALQEVVDLLKYKYVDSVHLGDLQEDAINALLKHLDPHSIYIPAEQLARINEDLNSNFEGIGIEYSMFNDTLNVVNVLQGGPSEEAGLQMGDKIIRVNDSLIAGVNISDNKIKYYLRGPQGSSAKLSLLRDHQEKTIQVKRGIIPLYSINAHYMVGPGIGYIKIDRFSESTVDEFMAALRELTRAGMEKLIIDVRQNPGGLLDAAFRISDQLLDGSKVVVYTEGVHSPKKEYKTNQPGLFEKGALVIMTDESSASASEVLAGAVQDWDRGTIIGRRTFGKGLVQDQYNLSDGGALRLTIARYYLPSGRSIQKSYKDGREAYGEDLENRYIHGELLNKDSIQIYDTVEYKTEKGRTVYGGGGIIPDVFVPYDTAHYSTLQLQIYQQNLYSEFAYEYYLAHKADFAGYKDIKDFIQEFTITPAILQSFYSYVQKASINPTRHSVKDDEDISLRLKALLARKRWDLNGYYEVMNQDDPMVETAVKKIQEMAE